LKILCIKFIIPKKHLNQSEEKPTAYQNKRKQREIEVDTRLKKQNSKDKNKNILSENETAKLFEAMRNLGLLNVENATANAKAIQLLTGWHWDNMKGNFKSVSFSEIEKTNLTNFIRNLLNKVGEITTTK
jgi:hypothetical protein